MRLRASEPGVLCFCTFCEKGLTHVNATAPFNICGRFYVMIFFPNGTGLLSCQGGDDFPWNDKISGGTSLLFVKSVVPPPLCKKSIHSILLFFANELQNRFFAKKSYVSAFYFLQMSFKAPSLQKNLPFQPSVFCK